MKMSVSPKANMDHQKQGIVSILGLDNCEIMRNKSASLRRTLSADMSSKIWLSQNGFLPMKKISSSEKLDEVWRSIQSRKEKNDDQVDEKAQGWAFGSILIQKNHEEESSPNDLLLIQPPYIHPLVKRSTSSLSGKSLAICTESLGSETGSDGFSSCPSSETGDRDEENHQQQSQISRSFNEDSQFVKYNYSPNMRKMSPRAFPPPLPSLARDDGASLHMHCHRQNGRLLLEAVSVPSPNCFHVQRQDGRLLLTLVNNNNNNPSSQEARDEKMEDVEEYAQVFDNIEDVDGNESEFEEEDEIEEEEDEEVEKYEKENNEMEIEVLEQKAKLPSGHVIINVHKSVFMRKKQMAVGNKNTTWSPEFNKAINFIGVDQEEEEEVVEVDGLTQLPQSLPPLPRVARLISSAASYNAYEYFWREKHSMASIIKPTSQEQGKTLKNNYNKAIVASNLKGYEQQDLVVMRGNKAEYLVPLLNRCNEPRRSLFWEPHCIPTS